MTGVVCWACRKKDGAHTDCCVVGRAVFANEPQTPTVAEMEFVRRRSVLSDDDVAWCRARLLARHEGGGA